MSTYEYKNYEPLLDNRELEMLDKLTKEYEEFVKPGVISNALTTAQNWISDIAPKSIQVIMNKAINAASELDMIKKALEHAGKGFLVLQSHASQLTMDKNAIVESLKSSNKDLERYEQICALRSYNIENVVGNQDYKNLIIAFIEGSVCGAPGLPGVPFNIALSFLIYFRAVQSIALYYGYNIKDEQSELAFAATVTIQSLTPTAEKSADTLGGLLGKMMFAANLTALKSALTNKTFFEMAQKGGSELLFVQIRALANMAAQKALNKAGKDGIEAGIFKNLLEQVSKYISKETAKKAIPIVGALVGGLSDTYYMNRILKGANMVYHKRFLFEKEQRIKNLNGK